MDIAEYIMDSRPDSALTILEEIKSENVKGKKAKARYALLYFIALDKNYVDTTDFSILQPAIDYYLKKGTLNDRLRTYYYQGRIFQNQGNDDAAVQSFMNGLEYESVVSDTLTLANTLVAEGAILYKTYKFDEFIQNNLKAAELYDKIDRHDYKVLSLLNVLDGSVINNNKNLADSIMNLLQNLVKINPEISTEISPYIVSYTLNFGSREEIKGILDNFTLKDSIDDELKMDLAVACYSIGKPYEAKYYIESIEPSSSVRYSVKYLSTKPAILEQTNDLADALSAYRVFANTIDSVHMRIFSHDLMFAQEQHEKEKASMNRIQRQNNIITIGVFVVFMLAAIIGLIYYRYNLGKAKVLLHEKEKQKLQLESYNQTIENAALQLKIEKLEDEKECLKKILEEQNDLSRPVADAIKVRMEMLNGLLAAWITDNGAYAEPYSSWRDKLVKDKNEFLNSTRLAFKASHPRFISYLEEHELSDVEINHVCLYAIGLRGKEVGKYMELSRHYHISSDIRKKLGIDEHQTNIGIYIRKLMKNL